ncbi:MAG: T9SS type A sorting domain-containing protein [Bacteroidota bacterium]
MLKYITKVLFFFISISSFSQVDYIKNNATLWLKNDTVTNCLSYNYNCPLEKLESNYKIYSNQFSFFIAYKTDNSTEKQIVSLKYGNKTIKISNKNVVKQNDTITVLDTNKSAKIVSYLHNDPTFSKKGKLFIDLVNSKDENILEIIFIPKVVSKFHKEKIETYLSLKYGFSLADKQYYRSVKNDTIWNPASLASFSKDVTGMGNDSANFYNRNKSYNHNLQGLELYTETLFSNNNYAMWGHNGKAKMIPNHNELATENYKIWHFKKHLEATDARLFKLKINKELLDSVIDTLLVNERIYLYVSHTNADESIDLYSGKHYVGVFNSDKDIVFENINLASDSRFIFIKAPEMYVFSRTLSECGEATALHLDFVEGNFPFNITVSNDKLHKNYYVENSKYIINDLPEGKYNIEVIDVYKNKKNIAVEIKDAHKFQVKLKESWNLNENNLVVVSPEILKSDTKLQYTWKKEEQILGTENTIQLETEGDYVLEVTNGVCEDKFAFKVISSRESFISLYPNPSKTNEEITLQLSKSNNEFVEVKITDINGKLIQLLNYKDLNTDMIKFHFDFSGVYFVHLKTKEDNKVFKVIIN